MKIFITIPDFSIHGGILVICNLANELSKKGYKVFLHPLKPPYHSNYFKVLDSVTITPNEGILETCDCMIITSPHSIHFEDAPRAPKTILFLQMLEHMFNSDPRWHNTCHKMYLSKNPILSISQWNIDYMKEVGRTAPTYYIANGINYEDFPIERPEKDGKTVLIEGVVAGNKSKDDKGIALKVAQRLKEEGYTIFGYTQHQIRGFFPDFFHQVMIKPSLQLMNDLYRQSSVLIKATHVDARSLSPLEAMTKGCVTARAIEHGDDDLIHEFNALRCDYNENQLYKITKRLLEDVSLRNRLAENGYNHLKSVCQWDKVIEQFEQIMK